MIRVASVRPGSIGAELDIPPGTRLLRLNGSELRDSLDLQFFEADEDVELELETPGGERRIYEIEKEFGESLGLVPEPDKVRRCTNACPFCFVKGNPKADKLRSALYIKDDDYRLSFMYGHYVTLTNLREEDWQRIEDQRLSPLYVSVHATDADVRHRMLVNPRSREIEQQLDRLTDIGVSCHAQAVLCPGLNDGAVLERTIQDLYARENILSLSIVPVGLTRFNADRGIRPLTPSEADAVIRCVAIARETAQAERGYGWAYASDELFLAAGSEPPGPEYFDSDELVSNGVGAISVLRSAVRADLAALPDLAGLRIVLVTGTAMSEILSELASEIEEACGANLSVVAQPNSLYGPTVTSAGLLAGADHVAALTPFVDVDLALFSRTALNDSGVFLDDMSLEELAALAPARQIRPADHVTDALLAA